MDGVVGGAGGAGLGRKLKWHKQLGLAGFGLAALMLILGVTAGTDALRRGMDGGSGLGAKTFYVIPLSGFLVFSLSCVHGVSREVEARGA